MADTDVIKIVSINVKTLMAKRWGKQNISQLGKAEGLSNGTAQRLVEGETSYGVEKVQAAAKAFDLEAWQLLVPGLDPDRPPELAGSMANTPLPPVDLQRFMNLSAESRAYVQGYLTRVLEEREAAENSRNGTR